MSTTKDTVRCCAHCGQPLVRKTIQRRDDFVPELEASRRFAHRHYCDMNCRWGAVRARRGVAPACACGCGRPASWRGLSRGGWGKYAPGCYLGPKRNPRHEPWVDDGSGFWDWLAGFLDGEGFFGFVPRTMNRTYHGPVVRISVRLDDRAILDEIAERLGGSVRVQRPYGTSKHQARWAIANIADCLRLIEILDRHPLRAKKAQDFATWRAAVLEKDRNGNTPELDRLVEKLIADRRWNPDCVEGGDANGR